MFFYAKASNFLRDEYSHALIVETTGLGRPVFPDTFKGVSRE